MSDQKIKRVSKFLSYVLRHQPETIGLELDENGWAEVSELLTKAARHNRKISFSLLEKVVTENDKQRFSFNETKTRIRANQGHSINLDLGLDPVEPPPTLFHGTATRFMESIMTNGLIKGSRHHVHLSADKNTAISVGSRHGTPVVLEVKAKAMHDAGFLFYCSENQVWLTDHVPVVYLEALS